MARIVIAGKGGSGKDYLKDIFVRQGFKSSINYTTRPMREGELDGIHYHFISREEFDNLITIGFFQEYDEFNGWYYGTSWEEWNKKDIFIKTPRGVDKITELDRIDTTVIYLDIKKDVRWGRLSKRHDADNVMRRIWADDTDFAHFKNYDIRIQNSQF